MIKKSIAIVLILLILIIQMGCFTYQEIKIEDKETIKVAGKVKITTLDDTVYYLFDVEVQGSTVKGKEKTKTNQIREVILSAEEIKKIEDEKFGAVQTIGFLLAIAGIALIVTAGIFAATYEK